MRSNSHAPSYRRWSTRSNPSTFTLTLLLLLCMGCGLSGCGKKETPPAANPTPQAETSAASSSAIAPEGSGGGAAQGTLSLPTSFGKRTGDLDEMVEQRVIRALLIVNPIGFFYSQGRPQGIQYEALEEFERFVNKKMNTGKLPVKVVFLPMRPDQLEAALTQGVGDIIAQGVVITPEREQRVAFSTVQQNVSHVVVTGNTLANVGSFDELAGKPIYVNPVTVNYDNLKRINDDRKKNWEAAS